MEQARTNYSVMRQPRLAGPLLALLWGSYCLPVGTWPVWLACFRAQCGEAELLNCFIIQGALIPEPGFNEQTHPPPHPCGSREILIFNSWSGLQTQGKHWRVPLNPTKPFIKQVYSWTLRKIDVCFPLIKTLRFQRRLSK